VLGRKQSATHCSTLQCAHCSTLQHTASHCNTLQHTVAPYNTLQHTQETKHHGPFFQIFPDVSTYSLHCSTLQHTAAHCNTLQQRECVCMYVCVCVCVCVESMWRHPSTTTHRLFIVVSMSSHVYICQSICISVNPIHVDFSRFFHIVSTICLCRFIFSDIFLFICMCLSISVAICWYRVAQTHRMPYLHRSCSAKEPYN